MWAEIPIFLIRSRVKISRFPDPDFDPDPDFEDAVHIGLADNIGLQMFGLTTLNISDWNSFFLSEIQEKWRTHTWKFSKNCLFVYFFMQ